jgi:hypothetical protein
MRNGMEHPKVKTERKGQSDNIKMDVMVMCTGLRWSRRDPVVQITTVVSSLYLATERLRRYEIIFQKFAINFNSPLCSITLLGWNP